MIVDTLTAAIDADHPIPIYLQIASTIRSEIARGRLPIGTSLPSVRSLGHALDISYHTVRHAWDLLAQEGVLSVRRGRGALIVAGPSPAGPWHLTPSSTQMPTERPVVWIVGAIWSHAATIARQLMASHAVAAAPWPLDAGMPPPGPILLLDGVPLPDDWAARRRDIHALATTLPRDAVAGIRRAAELLGTRDIRIAASDPIGPEMSALMRQLPRVGLTVLPELAADWPTLGETDRVVIVTDTGAAEAGTASDPRVLVLGRTPAAGPLAGLARELRWASM